MNGDPKSWKHMVEYNKRDVVLLEKIYLELRPWIQSHPNISVISELPDGCPNCGSLHLQKRGFGITKSGKQQRFQCLDCGSWSKGPTKKITNII
jgi:hypothetical protein